MTKVRWVMLYRFCSKFHTLYSSAKNCKSIKIWQSYREFKGGNFFETPCIFNKHLRHCDLTFWKLRDTPIPTSISDIVAWQYARYTQYIIVDRVLCDAVDRRTPKLSRSVCSNIWKSLRDCWQSLVDWLAFAERWQRIQNSRTRLVKM